MRSTTVHRFDAPRALLAFATVALLCGCQAKIPAEYDALGIPPSPERVAKIEKQDKPDNTLFMITYKAPPDPDAYVATNSKIMAAGYKRNERGDTFSGPKGSFQFACLGDYCRLELPKK